MDLVGYDQDVFERIRKEFRGFATKLEIPDLTFIPISALKGDNLINRSALMPWFDGSVLLSHLEQVHIASDRNLIDVRFPVQLVVRPMSSAFHDYRGYAGQIASGVLRVGDQLMALPSGLTTRVAAIETADGPLEEAYAPMSVTIRLEDDMDLSRGDMLCRPKNQPTVGQELDAMVCWLSEATFRPQQRLVLKHTTRSVRAMVRRIDYKLDINTLHRNETSDPLTLNEIARVAIRTTSPIFFDSYRRSRQTGSFILVDEATHATVAAGMISGTG
jgi:sulfate adenylyltransferase subunit 1 (EFTu-like GTPase family)